MLLRLCQLKSLLVIMLIATGCTGLKKTKRDERLITHVAEAKWFLGSPKHTLLDLDGKPVVHSFFDVEPEFSKDGKNVNVIMATTYESPNAFHFDLNSGQRYYSHSYCSQKDVWHEVNGSFNRPPFSIGYIPRAIDQLGEPQKIIVFGKHFTMNPNVNFLRVRIIGAFVEQLCPVGSCLGKDNWQSHLVFVAVDPEDEIYKDVFDVPKFLLHNDWTYLKATLENIDGSNSIDDRSLPRIRVRSLIEFNEAFNYFKKRSLYFTTEEMKKVQNGCFALYDRLWDEVGKERPEDKSPKTEEEKKTVDELKLKIRTTKLPVGFLERFKVFAQKYSKDFYTCSKFIYHGNINEDSDKFWFLAYLDIYFRLHHEGYYFDCERGTWHENAWSVDGDTAYKFPRDIKECDERDIDAAMDFLPTFLKSVKLSGKEFYSFIDYDNHPYGSHQKMYSWVKKKVNNFECFNDPNEVMREKIPVFPEEVSWKPRHDPEPMPDKKLIK